jgi:signal transduction histidine kinase
MKTDLPAFSKSYRAALQKHLAHSPGPRRTTSLTLGRRAVKLGLETLDLAKVHEAALVSLEPTKVTDAVNGRTLLQRASSFFAEVITPIEKNHQGANEANAKMKEALDILSRRTKELNAVNGKLKREIDRRKAAEASLRASKEVSSKLLKKSLQLQKELRLLSHRLLSIQEAMRQRLSRELHNVIAQSLTGLDLQLVTLKKQSATDAKDFHAKIDITQQLVKQSVETLHRFALDLRPSVLDDLGLIPALESHMKVFMEETGIRVTFSAYAGLEQVDDAVRTALYRVAQEALSNIAQHANASQTSVTIRLEDRNIYMEIHDNGKGFDVDDMAPAKSKRLGLVGMREHAEMLGGTLSIDSALGKETTVRVNIPRGKIQRRKRSSKSSAKKSSPKST